MERLNKFLRLPGSERWLLVKVTFLLGVTYVALRLLPFRSVYRLIGSAIKNGNKKGNLSNKDAARICNAINRSGRNFLSNDSCFPEALVGEFLLKRRGFPSKLRIGVIKDIDGCLHSHAWVELNGAVVIGGPINHVQKYMPLPDLDQINS